VDEDFYLELPPRRRIWAKWQTQFQGHYGTRVHPLYREMYEGIVEDYDEGYTTLMEAAEMLEYVYWLSNREYRL
jgi:hypothetical protein